MIARLLLGAASLVLAVGAFLLAGPSPGIATPTVQDWSPDRRPLDVVPFVDVAPVMRRSTEADELWTRVGRAVGDPYNPLDTGRDLLVTDPARFAELSGLSRPELADTRQLAAQHTGRLLVAERLDSMADDAVRAVPRDRDALGAALGAAISGCSPRGPVRCDGRWDSESCVPRPAEVCGSIEAPRFEAAVERGELRIAAEAGPLAYTCRLDLDQLLFVLRDELGVARLVYGPRTLVLEESVVSLEGS